MSAFEVTQPEIHTRPIAETARWQAVMQGADYRCQCSKGLCGSQHSMTGLRCPAEHDVTHVKGKGRARLIAAPLDLGLSDREAAAVPAADLRAWCPTCYQKARARARAANDRYRKMTGSPADTLF